MKFPLTVCVFLLTVIRSLSVDITVRGTEGEPVIIKCPYPGGYEDSTKYFYKGIYIENDIILQSDGGKSKDRFSLQDDRQTRSFTVTISDLKMEDSGLYGCRSGWREYKIIQLNVIRAPQRPKPVQIFTSTFYPASVVIIVTAAALVLLLIAVSLVIVAVQNKMKNNGLLEEFNPVFYEQIKDAGRHCNPEDRDTITTVFYSFVS